MITDLDHMKADTERHTGSIFPPNPNKLICF